MEALALGLRSCRFLSSAFFTALLLTLLSPFLGGPVASPLA
jgi:hypothetical protein